MKNVVGPAAARLRDTPALMPCTAAVITVTTNTPTAIPRMVRPARTLFDRMASSAMTTPSNRFAILLPRVIAISLLPHSKYGIQPRRAARGVCSRDDAHAGADDHGERHRPRRYRSGQ